MYCFPVTIVGGLDLKDGNDISFCLPDEDYDYVFHLAALPSVQQSVEQPSYTMRHNTLATSILLEWCKNKNVKRIVFSSSAAAKEVSSPYGLHKRMSEMECKLYSELYDLDTVCLRYYNVYSEDQRYGGPYSTVISAWMEMIRNGDPLRIDGDGYQTRDFIHVDDIVSANICAMQSVNSFNGAVYDIGTGEAVAVKYIKNFISSSLEVEWKNSPERKADIRHSIADISKTKEDLMWEPKIYIPQGLKRCFNNLTI